jgi:hypothetical protein
MSNKSIPDPKKLLIVEQKTTIKNVEIHVVKHQDQIKEQSKENNLFQFEIDKFNRSNHKHVEELNELRNEI